MDAIRKDKNILIVGEKLRETSELLGMLFARVDQPIHCRFFYLAEEKFRYEALDVYMSFDAVMCPCSRICGGMRTGKFRCGPSFRSTRPTSKLKGSMPCLRDVALKSRAA